MAELIIFRCLQTGMDVQTFLHKQEQDETRAYEAVICPACTRLHFIDKSTGKALGSGQVSDDDPNDAYEVLPIEPGPHGPPKGWWTVKRSGIAVRHFPGKEKAERYATDPEYRASLAAGKAWEKAKGK